MTAYYPSQGSHAQPVVYSNGYQPTQYAPSNQYYGQDGGVLYVPTHSSHHSRHSHRSHSHHHPPQVIAAGGPQVIMQPTQYGDGYHHHYHLSFGERIRRFFGLAPRGPFKYRHNRGTWGFLGYSRRQRYADARTGAEVDRKGRPIYRV